LTVAPAAPRLIDRADLVAALDRAATRKVTIISAPAGSGKTSLLRAWADRPGQSHRLALVQVQRGQRDTQQFWLALLDSVRHATGADSGTEPSPGTPDFNAPAMAGRVLSELADARGGVTLVIDDLHELTSPEALAQLLMNLPPQVHAILTTRHDVRLGLHELRLAGELAEVRAADLRFSERETRKLLDASGIALSEAGVALLHQQTEGWAAGLRLATIALAGHPDPERFVAEFSGSELRRTLPAEVPMLHRRAAEWFIGQGQVVDAIRHAQAAGDWADAARLLADQSFSLTLDGQAQTMQALLQAFPPGEDHPELALVRATVDLLRGRLDQAAAHLTVAETYAETAPPDRQRRLRVAVASLQLSLATRRGDLAGVVEQARFLASPVTGQSDEDIALGSDLRAVALMNLGIAEAWALGGPDGERHLREGTVLAQEIGRPYLEVACLARLGFASLGLQSFATIRRRCIEAIALAERYGWGVEPVIAPALIMLAGMMAWVGEFDEGERWLRRAAPALRADTGPDLRLHAHMASGLLQAGRGRHHEAFQEFSEAEHLRSQMQGSHARDSQMTAWLLDTQARAGMTDQARAFLAALDDERASSGEIRNALAVICLAEGDPAGALAAVADVLDGTSPVLGYVTVVNAHLLAGLAYRELGDQRAASQAAERALALAEPDRLILPFAMTGSAGLLEALPRHETAHASLLADILDVLYGSSPAAKALSSSPAAEELSPGELRVLRYLPTNLSRPEIAGELSVSPNTVNAHVRSIYAKLGVGDRSSAVRRARELRLLTAAARTR
jgi:LuxR family maltose regulon positive regulatory protein